MQLADSQERHAQLDDRVIETERKLAESREQQRTLERQAQEATFALRSLASRRRSCTPLHRHIAASRPAPLPAKKQQAREELTRLTDAAAQAGLQSALSVKLEREAALGAKRSQYDDLTNKLRASDERRLQLERELDPLRQRITEFQLKEQAARLGLEQYAQLLADAQADLAAVEQSIQSGNVRLTGLQGEIDRINREIAVARRGQPGRAGRAEHGARTQAVPRRAIRRPERSHDHAGRCDQEDRHRNTRAATRAPSTRSTGTSAACSPNCSAAAMPSS